MQLYVCIGIVLSSSSCSSKKKLEDMEINDSCSNISKSDCDKIISKKLGNKNFTIVNFCQRAFGEMNGYLGEHSSLEITIEHNRIQETCDFFVKSLPKAPSQRNFLFEINGLFKEKQFFTKYRQMLKEHSIDILEEAIPTCYHTNTESLIFENMKSQGYVTLKSGIPLSIESVKLALTSVAKLHASGLILEETKSFKLNEAFKMEGGFYAGTKSTETAMGSSKHGIRALIDLTHQDSMKISKEMFLEKALEGCNFQTKFVEPSRKFRNTICHGDLWTNNLMFQFENDRPVNCIIVDFQSYYYAPPVQDVMALIHLVTDRKFRDENLEELLNFYFEKLSKNLGKFGFDDVITKSEFFESCQYYKRFVLTQTVTHFLVILMSQEVAEELFLDQDEAKKVLFENKYDFIVKTCQRDPIFRKMNFEAIAELREFYENKL